MLPLESRAVSYTSSLDRALPLRYGEERGHDGRSGIRAGADQEFDPIFLLRLQQYTRRDFNERTEGRSIKHWPRMRRLPIGCTDVPFNISGVGCAYHSKGTDAARRRPFERNASKLDVYLQGRGAVTRRNAYAIRRAAARDASRNRECQEGFAKHRSVVRSRADLTRLEFTCGAQ